MPSQKPAASWTFFGRVATLLALTSVACSCQTDAPPTPPVESPPARVLELNTSPAPIENLYGLDLADLEFAILLAVMDPEQPPALDAGRLVDEVVLTSIRAGMTDRRLAGNPWSLVERQPGFVFATYRRDGVSMRVAIRFDDRHILMRILESEHLGQTEDRIDADALARLDALDRRIRERVTAVAQRNWYHHPVPASPANP